MSWQTATIFSGLVLLCVFALVWIWRSMRGAP